MSVVNHFFGRAGRAFLQICACAESFFPCARDDDHLHVFAQIECGEQFQQLQAQCPIDRIERGRAVERNDSDTVFDGEQVQSGSRHLCSPLYWKMSDGWAMGERASTIIYQAAQTRGS